MRIYKCEHCGTMVAEIKLGGCQPSCCGEKMTLLEAGTSDGALEKHVPVYTVDGNIVSVQVGEVVHPMLEAHYIEWIALETSNGRQRKRLEPGQEPKAQFALLDGEEVTAVYEYCNLHGLWKG